MTGSYYYIPINPDTKRPAVSFGGWPIDPSHEAVVTIDEVEESDHEWWATVGNKTSDLLILDVDLYKMSDAEQAEVEYGWFGILDDTRIVKSPSGGIHVYIRTDADFEDLPRAREYIDLKGDVARGYCLTHPKDEYTVQADCRPVEISETLVRELPVFQSNRARGSTDSADPVVDEEEMRAKTSPPCLSRALDSDTEFSERLVSSVKYGTVDKLPVYRVLNRSKFPENSNEAAPSWLHNKPSSTGTNFRVDDGGETFRCWRHDVTGNAYHLLGVKFGVFECGDWAHEEVDMAAVKEQAREEGYVTEDDVISCETVKKNDLCPFDCGRRHPFDGVVE